MTSIKRTGAVGQSNFLAALLFVIGMIVTAPVFGQNGGTVPNFILGAGARAIALGGATVAMPVDATTLYWNPGGLASLERKNLALFYTPLLGGTKYNFIGYVHPTLAAGSFGIAWMHYDVGEVAGRDGNGAETGQQTWGQDQFLVSYGYEFPFALSLGGSIKLDRQTFTGYEPATGFSVDLGLLYQPDLGEGALRDLTVGFTVQNLIEPRLKLGDTPETYPRILRAGVAKPLQFGDGASAVNLFLGMQGGGGQSRFQFGSEYVYQNRAMLRAGFNGSAMSLGAGVIYQNFEIDYALAKYSTDDKEGVFAPQHRIGLTVNIGKSKTELIELERQREQERIAKQLERELLLKNKADFDKFMEDGKVYFQRGDFFQAHLRFTQASRVFPGDEDAQVWTNRAKEKHEEEQRRQAEERDKLARVQAAREADSSFVAAQFDLGMNYFNAGDYGAAVREWETGLKRDPGNALLQSWIQKTRSSMETRVSDMVRRARALEAAGKQVEAVQAYNQVLNEGNLSASEQAEITNTIARLQTQLSVKELVRQGVTAYNQRDYRAALGYFDEVLKTDPRNALAQKYRDDAEARLNARVKEFASERHRQRFAEAVRLSQAGNHAGALKILEEIQQEDRYNRRILDAIDQARDKLNRNGKGS